jgi:NADPH-dependent 2,4-dienoyl-CoA reductase/sulfur reductase-like enzyme
MRRPSRRDIGKLLAAAGVSAAAAPVFGRFAIAQADAKVVIVGGGAGGATVAHYLRAGAPDLDITLIEANPIYSSAFFSNHYLGGIVRTLESLNHGNGGLQRVYVKVVHDLAIDVNPVRKTVRTRGGRVYNYDRLVLSPGIDLDYGAIAGYSREVAAVMPHAYTAGAAQKRLLKRQLLQMRPGGTVVMTMPAEPYGCPAGPYERACMIAHYLKTRKPRSKLVVLDPKRAFSKQALFEEAFRKYYQGILELHLSTPVDDFSVARLNPRSRQIVTKSGKTVRADVANIIPRQRAGEIAVRAGCAEGDWCPVHTHSFLSRRVPDVYVLGDAAIAADMPKSAFAANSQAKAVAAHILAALTRTGRAEPSFRHVCWSLLAPDDSVKHGADYTPRAGRLEAAAAFASQTGEPAELRRQNYQESVAWYASITDDIFAKTAEPPAEKGSASPVEKAAPPLEKDAAPPAEKAVPPGEKAG